jgi:hypothetical protein
LIDKLPEEGGVAFSSAAVNFRQDKGKLSLSILSVCSPGSSSNPSHFLTNVDDLLFSGGRASDVILRKELSEL